MQSCVAPLCGAAKLLGTTGVDCLRCKDSLVDAAIMSSSP